MIRGCEGMTQSHHVATVFVKSRPSSWQTNKQESQARGPKECVSSSGTMHIRHPNMPRLGRYSVEIQNHVRRSPTWGGGASGCPKTTGPRVQNYHEWMGHFHGVNVPAPSCRGHLAGFAPAHYLSPLDTPLKVQVGKVDHMAAMAAMGRY